MFSDLFEDGVDEDPLGLRPDATPLDACRAVYLNGRLPMGMRLKAMIEALPYVHPKLSAIAMLNERDLGARLDRAIERSRVRLNGRRVIEAKPIENGAKTRFQRRI